MKIQKQYLCNEVGASYWEKYFTMSVSKQILIEDYIRIMNMISDELEKINE